MTSSIDQVLAGLDALETRLKAQIAGVASQVADVNSRVEKQERGLEALETRLKAQIAGVASQVADVNSRVERQERRLEAIETFPAQPVRKPPRLYGTEVESVSLARRVRVGRAG